MIVPFVCNQIMPYLLLAVRVGGGLAKMVPLVGDATKELAELGKSFGQAAINAAMEAPNTWYDEHVLKKELDMCAGVKNYLETAEGILMTAEKKAGNYMTDKHLATQAPNCNVKSVGRPDLRALQGMNLQSHAPQLPFMQLTLHMLLSKYLKHTCSAWIKKTSLVTCNE